MKKFFLPWLPPLLYFLLIWNFSAKPIPFSLPQGSDKLIHLVEYAVMGVLIARAVFLTWNSQRWAGVTWAWLLASLLGLIDELHQSFIPGRFASAYDFLADSIGALLGALLFIALGSFLFRRGVIYSCEESCSIDDTPLSK